MWGQPPSAVLSSEARQPLRRDIIPHYRTRDSLVSHLGTYPRARSRRVRNLLRTHIHRRQKRLRPRFALPRPRTPLRLLSLLEVRRSPPLRARRPRNAPLLGQAGERNPNREGLRNAITSTDGGSDVAGSYDSGFECFGLVTTFALRYY